MDETDSLADAPESEELLDDVDQEVEEPELDEYGNPVEPEPEESEEDDDLEDVEIDGKTYKVPRDAAFRQADYTRKTMEVAERRKELDAAIERIGETSKQETEALQRVAYVDAQLAQFRDIDWALWDQQNPVEANRARWQLTELQNMRKEAEGAYTQAQQNSQIVAQQEAAKRVEEGHKVLAERIPGWNKDKATAILDFGQKTYGFSREQLMAIDDPLAIVVLHDAMEGRKASQKAATAQKIAQKQSVKPASRVRGGKAPADPLSDASDIDAWMKARSKQVAKRNA